MRQLPIITRKYSSLLRKIKKLYPEIYTSIFQETSWLPINVSDRERVYAWSNELISYPKCPICGSDLTRFYCFTLGYHSFCSKECGKKANLQNGKQTCLQKYGVENPAQSTQIREKIQRTWLEKSSGIFDEIQDKRQKTNLERYGVEFPAQSKIIKDKANRKNFETYGVSHTFQRQDVKEKIKQTNIERHGMHCNLQWQKDQIKQTCMKKYGKEIYGKWEEFCVQFMM